METDIRKMIEGLRPVADFKDHVGRTIDVLDTRAEDMIPCDEEDEREQQELRDLSEFWSRVLEGMGEA